MAYKYKNYQEQKRRKYRKQLCQHFGHKRAVSYGLIFSKGAVGIVYYSGFKIKLSLKFARAEVTAIRFIYCHYQRRRDFAHVFFGFLQLFVQSIVILVAYKCLLPADSLCAE